MGFFQALKYILKYGPSVFFALKEILSFIADKRKHNESEANFHEVCLNRALDHCRNSGDSKPLKELRDELRERGR